jgi:hypothetical protein
MSEDKSDDASTAKQLIQTYLTEHGRATVHELATETDFSHSHTREVAKDLLANGTISGTKTKPIIGCNVRGTTMVLTSNRDGMLRKLEIAAPEHLSRARSLTIPDLHDLIKRIADSIGLFARRWEFWIDPDDPMSAEGEAEAGAD